MRRFLILLTVCALPGCIVAVEGDGGGGGGGGGTDPQPRFAHHGSVHLKYGIKEEPCFDAGIRSLRNSQFRIDDTVARGRRRSWITAFAGGGETKAKIFIYRHDHKSRITIDVWSNVLTNYECRKLATSIHRGLGDVVGQQGH